MKTVGFNQLKNQIQKDRKTFLRKTLLKLEIINRNKKRKTLLTL